MDLSLLVHTCDDYVKFWPGMLFSLDFNWDYNLVPVYWSSEELNLHTIPFSCKGIPYKANDSIIPILTGKTDKNGFSDRLIQSLESIPNKWVIYLQEDMWLLSNLSENLLNKLILFCESQNANSIKIHTKLHYYFNYKLEPTEHILNNTKVLKYSDGENFLLSHNATIWNREYLLEHLIKGEDPWTNEIKGSERMSSKKHNHFHYNIHWYSQPGVCDKGEYNNDFYILAPLLDERMNTKLKYE